MTPQKFGTYGEFCSKETNKHVAVEGKQFYSSGWYMFDFFLGKPVHVWWLLLMGLAHLALGKLWTGITLTQVRITRPYALKLQAYSHLILSREHRSFTFIQQNRYISRKKLLKLQFSEARSFLRSKMKYFLISTKFDLKKH